MSRVPWVFGCLNFTSLVEATASYMLRWAHGNIASNFREIFVKFRGFKLCGGFHPDFSLVWGTGDSAVEIHVCFGCHELKAFRKGVEVYCDIPNGTYDELKKLLQKYRK